jgi:transposase
MYHDVLAKLSTEELIALVLAQAAQIEAQSAQIEELTRRIAELEAKLGGPPKTPDNSSVAAIAGAQAQPRRAPRGEKAKGTSRSVSGACSPPGPDRRQCCRTLPAL